MPETSQAEEIPQAPKNIPWPFRGVSFGSTYRRCVANFHRWAWYHDAQDLHRGWAARHRSVNTAKCLQLDEDFRGTMSWSLPDEAAYVACVEVDRYRFASCVVGLSPLW